LKDEEFASLIDEAYPHVCLKNAARNAGRVCVKKANELATGKEQKALSERKNSNAAFSLLHFL
jgi:hypothetical protein